MLTKSYSFFISVLLCLISLPNFIQAHQTNKIKVLTFDFGGVIAKVDKAQVSDYIAQTLGISLKEALQAQVELKRHLVKGGKEEDFWILYTRSNEIPLPGNWMEKLDQIRLKAIKEIPGMVNVVKNLQKQGFQTALLSNVRMSQANLKRQLGYYNLFYPVLLSYEIKAAKPDDKAYQILLDALKVPPQAVLFIDNKPINVEAAKAMGMDGIVFTNADHLIEELKKRGINVSKTASGNVEDRLSPSLPKVEKNSPQSRKEVRML